MRQKIKRKRLFYGFSTAADIPGRYTLYDIDIVKQDIYNEFMTRKGERVMLPTYGSIVWDLLFDPLTEGNKDLIVEDTQRIANKDPRTELINVGVDEYEHGISVSLLLEYKPFNIQDTLYIQFQRSNNEEE